MPRKKAQTWETEQAQFPSRLSEVMRERRVSQEKLANALGVKRQTVSLYKTGQSSPNAEQLRMIAEFFDVSADWFLGLSEEPTINGDLAQASRYTGLAASSVDKLHELSVSSTPHSKALPYVIDRIIGDRSNDFMTWVWRGAMASCCTKASISETELAAVRHSADMRLVESANGDSAKTVELPIVEYEDICISTAVGIIQESVKKALFEFRSAFIKAFQKEKSSQ